MPPLLIIILKRVAPVNTQRDRCIILSVYLFTTELTTHMYFRNILLSVAYLIDVGLRKECRLPIQKICALCGIFSPILCY